MSYTVKCDGAELQFAQLFTRLDQLLYQSRQLWQLFAFNCDTLPWQSQFPTLAETVWALDDAQLDHIDACPELLFNQLLPALQQDLAEKNLQWELSLLSRDSLLASNFATEQTIDNRHTAQNNPLCSDFLASREASYFSAGIKGRKWTQITSFANYLEHSLSKVAPKEMLEWCAGKGHLGRLLAKVFKQPVVSLEWQQELCDQGEMFAKRWQLEQKFICGDAFSEQSSLFKIDQCALALHACGDLHIELLKQATTANTRTIAISPCCYHLIQSTHYQKLSQIANQSLLTLSRHDLQLPLQQSVIASEKQQQRRLKEISWRLGFDSLQRDISKKEQYLPIPSIKQSQLQGDFTTFCRWAAAKKSVTLNNTIDFNYYLEQGITRQRLTRRIDLVSHLFRHALEQWLLLDRVCFLVEQGYEVSMKQFCETRITPRNWIIVANKRLM